MTLVQRASTSSSLRWALLAIPIAAWAFHLVFSAAAVEWTCNAPAWRWILYAVTPIAALPVIVCIALAVALQRSDPAPDSEIGRQRRFLDLLIIASGVFNLVLIVAEGIVVPFLGSCD